MVRSSAPRRAAVGIRCLRRLAEADSTQYRGRAGGFKLEVQGAKSTPGNPRMVDCIGGRRGSVPAAAQGLAAPRAHGRAPKPQEARVGHPKH
eukprot:8491288-Pyramimonas_sp.AAC.1